MLLVEVALPERRVVHFAIRLRDLVVQRAVEDQRVAGRRAIGVGIRVRRVPRGPELGDDDEDLIDVFTGQLGELDLRDLVDLAFGDALEPGLQPFLAKR
jgi:hypothetical protein